MADRIAIRALCAAVQTAAGTPATPTLTANRLSTIGPVTFKIHYMETGKVTGEQDGGLGATRKMASAGRWVSFDVSIAAKGPGADLASSLPQADPLWRAAGCTKLTGFFGGTPTAVVGYTTLDSGTFELATFIGYTGSTKFTVTDCIAMPKFSVEAGKRGVLTFSVVGLMAADPVTAAIGTQSADTVPDPIWRGAANAIGGVSTLRFKKLALDLGTVHTVPAHAGAADAIAEPVITDRQVKLDLTVEKVALTTFNPYVLGAQGYPGGTLQGVSTVIGGGLYNTVSLYTGHFAFGVPDDTDNSGIIDWPLSGEVMRSGVSGTGLTAAGREFLIVYS